MVDPAAYHERPRPSGRSRQDAKEFRCGTFGGCVRFCQSVVADQFRLAGRHFAELKSMVTLTKPEESLSFCVGIDGSLPGK